FNLTVDPTVRFYCERTASDSFDVALRELGLLDLEPSIGLRELAQLLSQRLWRQIRQTMEGGRHDAARRLRQRLRRRGPVRQSQAELQSGVRRGRPADDLAMQFHVLGGCAV